METEGGDAQNNRIKGGGNTVPRNNWQRKSEQIGVEKRWMTGGGGG